MNINTQMSQTEINQLNYRVGNFNRRLEEQNQSSKNSLDEADFMKLLVTQLKNQDPTKPTDNQAFIGQMAQFTSLKQMNNLAQTMTQFTKKFDFTKAVNLVNKEVSWVDQSGNYLTGLVQSIKVKSGDTFLNVGQIGGQDFNMEVELNQVTEVW